MSTYLLAIYVGELSTKSMMTCSNKTNVMFDISMLAWKGMDDYLEDTLKAAVTIQDWFGKYFDLPFPLPKQDLANLPQFFGGMENWGLIMLASEVALLERSDPLQSYSLIAHEIAHMWFGDLVTMKWWDEMFLNEALTTFYSFRGQLAVYPKQSKWIEQQRMTYFRFALNADILETTHPIVFSDGGNGGSSITYSKGSSMFSMIETILDEEHFKKAIVTYLKKHSYNNTDRNDLWHALTTVTKEMPDLKDWCGNQLDMKEFAEPWFLQQNFPVVNVRKTTNATNPSFTLSQENINNDTAKLPPSEFGYKWPIPIWYRSDEGIGTKMTWLGSGRNNTCQQSDVTVIQAKWLAVNVNNRAFIRVRYDDESWDALLQQIESDKKAFDAEYLAQLLHDLHYFAYANGSDSEKWRVYDLMNQLAGIESGAIMTMVTNLLKKQKMLKSCSAPDKKPYMENFLSPLAKKTAWIFSDDYEARTYYQVAWATACKCKIYDCPQIAYDVFASCMKDYYEGGILKGCASVPSQKWFLLPFGVTLPNVTHAELALLQSAVAEIKELQEQGGYLPTQLHRIFKEALENVKQRNSANTVGKV